ncbi:MAG: hypothetical protein ACREUK_03330 [Burkholderiales bacterium]
MRARENDSFYRHAGALARAARLEEELNRPQAAGGRLVIFGVLHDSTKRSL